MGLKKNPFAFLRQVQSEMMKVVWPSRREMGVSTLMVLLMVILSAMFFFLSDWLMSLGIGIGISFLSGLFQ
ncbi:MAG: preprotein translocase subunit SecE [Candidatus Tokpelaia sp. JSC161]|jgi:preprotein translocase subunit SecE|nr:MAG: preprotein translocase subunit SecE [Candidatus Tokpelaia sp. JSC161]